MLMSVISQRLLVVTRRKLCKLLLKNGEWNHWLEVGGAFSVNDR